MLVKINEKYANDFVTTQKGFTIRKEEIKEADLDDVEVKSYIEQGILWIVKAEKMEKPKIIKTDIPKKTVKEVVSEQNNIDEALEKKEDIPTEEEDFIEE